MENDEIPNPTKSINSAFNSVTLINGIIDGSKLPTEKIEVKKTTVERNYKHLEVMKSKDWFMSALTETQLTEINDTIQSGKTTISKRILWDKPGVFHIDGDDLRDLFENKDYSETGRRKNVELAQQIAQYLHKKGQDVVVSLVSPYKDQRDKFKEKIGNNLIEVFVHTTEIRGRENYFVSDYQQPVENYFDLDTTNETVEESVKKLLEYASAIK